MAVPHSAIALTRRETIAGGIATLLSSTAGGKAAFDARVGQSGYSSIEAALDAAPVDGGKPYRILIGEGVWREKLVIEKPFIHLIGAHRSRSVVAFDASAGQPAPDGQPWGTSRSATVIVRAPGFAVSNLTIKNAFDYLGYFQQAGAEPTGPNRAQAVALMLDAKSDRAQVENCEIEGYQDTLFVNAGRSLFRDCHISGTVDFIFGAGNALFERCEVVSRFRPGSEKQGYIAAPSTFIDREFGLTFLKCRLTREQNVPANSVSLGRAWRPTTNFPDGRYGNPKAIGKAVFIRCWMDAHIEAAGWDAMEYGARDGSRVRLEPREARFFEYRSRGPGARTHTQRRLLSEQEADRYTVDRLFGDWQP